MTWAKGIALVMAFVGAVALGVFIGPHVTHRDQTSTDMVSSTAPATTAAEQSEPKHGRTAHGPVRAKKPNPAKTAPAWTPAGAPGATPPEVPAAAPALHQRLKPLLNSAEQFAAVAHAARNTDIPFMLLKDRTVNERKDLEEAIRELKPDANAVAEARTAREQAKADISALTTG